MMHIEGAVSSQEANCTVLMGVGGSEALSAKEIKESLEKGDVAARAEAMKHLIRLHINGEPQNHMIMTVIKHIVPVDDHLVKKLLLYFWEVIDKTDKDGKLLSVIILICSFLRSDLQHPNEYVRGLTLRFLCKINEKELVEPLISTVVQNLTHRVTYVRRNAVLTVHAIYRKFPDLLPDAPELVEAFIREESDVSALRNAFDMLAAFAPERAARFLSDFRDTNDMSEAGGCFLMSVVDFCRQMIRENPYDKAKYVPVLFSVLQTKSPAVRYQCATTLLSLSSSPTAIRQATITFIDLLKSHSDNSVRLIVVEQLDSMRGRFLEVLQDSLMDVLSALQNGTMEVRQRIVALAIELLSPKNVEAFVQAMKKELLRAQSDGDLSDSPAGQEYKLMVVKAIGAALVRHPQSAPLILPVLLDFLCDTDPTSAEVVLVVKEVLHLSPSARAGTLKKLMDSFPAICSSDVLRSVLWVFGTYAESKEEVMSTFALLKDAFGALPLVAPEVPAARLDSVGERAGGTAAPTMQAVTSVREDGTYVTTYTTVAQPVGSAATAAALDGFSGLRTLIAKGDYFLGTAFASTLSKLVIQLHTGFGGGIQEGDPVASEAQSDAVAILSEILRYGTASDTLYPMDEDAQEHTRLMLSLLSHPRSGFFIDVVQQSRSFLGTIAKQHQQQQQQHGGQSEGKKPGSGGGGGGGADAPALCPVDAPVVFTQLMTSSGKEAVYEMEAADDTMGGGGGGGSGGLANKGKGGSAVDGNVQAFLRKLEETIPLSGFSDPVYCEASIDVYQFEVIVDWLLVNRTSQQLEGLTIELASLGGMKLCERPPSHSLPPHSTLKVKTALKVSATESGVIYGSVLYDAPNGERCAVILNDIHVDIMNYIRPAVCTPQEFRSKWNIFDWENKINVSTDKHELRDYVEFIVQQLNMQLLDDLPEAEEDAEEAEEGEITNADGSVIEGQNSHYASCNLYARTVFGEDALVNISAERDSQGAIIGVVRIRSNTQTLAYGIGEKLSLLQKMGQL